MVFRTGGAIISTPVIGKGDRIYIGAADGVFYAIDPQSQDHEPPEPSRPWKWTVPAVDDGGDGIDSAACISDNGVVYYGNFAGFVFGVTESTGEKVWTFVNNGDRPRARFSPSPIYWFEANVVQGPDRAIFAGCDDFCFYRLPEIARNRDGIVQPEFGFLTGLHIWAAPAFNEKTRTVYVPSFDLHLYALEMKTGELRWRVYVHNFCASTPAIDTSGTIYFGCYNGGVYAVEDFGNCGRLTEIFMTGGPIYGSPALYEGKGKPRMYIGSLDGVVYAFDLGASTANPVDTFFIGQPIIGSAAIGPDPKNQESHLVYVAASDGSVFALTPDLNMRWRFDSQTFLVNKGVVHNDEFPGINSSIALGDHGLATANAEGLVFYLPYTWLEAVTHKDTGGFIHAQRSKEQPLHGEGFHKLRSSGRLERSVVVDGQIVAQSPYEAIALRAVARDTGSEEKLRFHEVKRNATVSVDSGEPPEIRYPGDGATVVLTSDGPFTLGATRSLTLRAQLAREDSSMDSTFSVRCDAVPGALEASELVQRPFTIFEIAQPWPPVVPTFDMIGIAEIVIYLRIIELSAPDSDGAEKGVAWGVEYFNTGVKEVRRVFYAFDVTYRAGHLLINALDTWFESTAFRAPLKRLRIATTCKREADTIAIDNNSLVFVLDRNENRWNVGRLVSLGVFRVIRDWSRSKSNRPSYFTILRDMSLFLIRVFRLIRRLCGFERSLPERWGIYDFRDLPVQGTTVGTFKAESDPDVEIEGVPIHGQTPVSLARPLHQTAFYVEAVIDDQRVVEQVDNPQSPMRHLLGILICEKDEKGHLKVLMKDYTLGTLVRKTSNGNVKVKVPFGKERKSGRTYRAYLMLGLQVIDELDL